MCRALGGVSPLYSFSGVVANNLCRSPHAVVVRVRTGETREPVIMEATTLAERGANKSPPSQYIRRPIYNEVFRVVSDKVIKGVFIMSSSTH